MVNSPYFSKNNNKNNNKDVNTILRLLRKELGITETETEAPAPSPPLSTTSSPASPTSHMPSPNRDGTAAIKNGQLTFNWPTGKGRFPILKPTPGVELYINNVKVETERAILPNYIVKVVPKGFPPVSELIVQISPDKMEAYAELKLQDGYKCILLDSEPQHELVLKTKEIEKIPAQKPSLEELRKMLHEKGVVRGIIESALSELLEHPNSGFRLVAQGNPPIYPEDAKLQPLLDCESESLSDKNESDRVNHYERDNYFSVKAGTIIAQKKPPVHGVNGLTVTGEVIEVPEPKDFEMQPGPGVTITEDGLYAIATTGGRPVIEGWRISVISQRVIPRNVDITTGNIHFTGDIFIRGTVCDNTLVTAGGAVEVFGNVEEAKIAAQGNIIVHGNVIASSLEAGIINGNEGLLVASLAKTKELIEQILQAFHIISATPEYQKAKEKNLSEGYLLRLVIETKGSQLPKIAEQMKELLLALPEENRDIYSDIVNIVYDLFRRGMILTVDSPSVLEMHQHKLEQVIAFGEARKQLASNVQLKVNYVQNSSLKSHGSVIIEGKGCYTSDIYAFKDIIFKKADSVFRGGKITCEKGKVILAEVGSPSGAETVVNIIEKGEITAQLAHPNVVFAIGHQTVRLDEAVRLVEVRVGANGKLDIAYLRDRS